MTTDMDNVGCTDLQEAHGRHSERRSANRKPRSGDFKISRVRVREVGAVLAELSGLIDLDDEETDSWSEDQCELYSAAFNLMEFHRASLPEIRLLRTVIRLTRKLSAEAA